MLQLLLILTPAFAQQVPERLWTQPAIMAAVAQDLGKQPVLARPYTRYFDLGELPLLARLEYFAVLSGHCNHLSRESDIVKPTVVPGTDGALVRINLEDYGWKTETWEQLAETDPYYHTKVTLTETVVDEYLPWPGGRWSDGKYYPPGAFRYRTQRQASKTVTQTAIAPWAGDPQSIAAAVALSQSKVPVVRGQWFVFATGIQAERGKTGYYDWLRVTKRADFETLVGFDAKLMKASNRRELLEAVADSGISQQPRRIAALPTIGSMRLWRTFDNREAIDKRNPLRVLDNDNFQFDASEEFGPLPNGLWGFGLFDAKGGRQDSAPDFVGFDATTHSRDGRIHVGLSCVRCHYPNGGLNPVDAWARNLLRSPLVLQSPDPAKARELRQQYLRSLDGPMDDDRRVFARALGEATGLAPKEYARAYGAAWAAYDGPVSRERAARELGTTPDALTKALEGYLRATGSLDTVLAAYVARQPRSIPLKQWLEVYGTAQTILRGAK